VWHAGHAAGPIAPLLRTHGAKRNGFDQVVAGYSRETRWDGRCDCTLATALARVVARARIEPRTPAASRLYALALGARAVTQPCSICRPPGFGVGAGAVLVPAPGPELGPEGTVVVVDVVVVGATPVVVVVVVGATVVVVVVVPCGRTRLMPPAGAVVVVVVVEEVVVVVGATVVVVVLGVAGESGVDGGVDPPALWAPAAAGVGCVITAVVQAPAFCRVSTSPTRCSSR